MTTLDDLLEEQLQDSTFKEKYDALEPEFMVIQAMIDMSRSNLSAGRLPAIFNMEVI